jgi:hypothetical protein
MRRAALDMAVPIVDSANRPWPTSRSARGGDLPGRAARGSVAPRKMACRPVRGVNLAVQGHRLALEGAATVLPLFYRERQMSLKDRDLALFAACALLCRFCLDYGSRCFQRGLSCARCTESLGTCTQSAAQPMPRASEVNHSVKTGRQRVSWLFGAARSTSPPGRWNQSAFESASKEEPRLGGECLGGAKV